jgi:hypothetical protein
MTNGTDVGFAKSCDQPPGVIIINSLAMGSRDPARLRTRAPAAGRERTPVSVSAIKQIAGRAGRRNSDFSEGRVTCLDRGDVRQLREALATPLTDLKTDRAGLFPEFEHLEVGESVSEGIQARGRPCRAVP